MSLKKIGKLTFNVIKILGLNFTESNIYLDEKRKKHMIKHFGEFSDFEKTFNNISTIISEPDYVGLHPNGKSIEFIKNTDGNVLVAVRIGKKFNVRTMYVISETKLKNYINAGRTFKI